MNCPLHIIKELSTPDKNLPMKRYLKSVYRQSTGWQLKQNASNFRSNCLMLPISIMGYLQLGRKHIFSSLRAIQYSLLTIYFPYVFAEKKKLFFDYFVKDLRTTCIITAAIRLLCCFLNKWIWKTRYYYFLHKPTKKERGSIYGNVTWHRPKKGRISLYRTVTWQWPNEMRI